MDKNSDAWFTTYIGYERKSKRKNRLIINAYPTNPELRSVRLFLRNVEVPSRLIHEDNTETLIKVIERIRSDPALKEVSLSVHPPRNFEYKPDIADVLNGIPKRESLDMDYLVLHAKLPHDRRALRALKSNYVFQIGNSGLFSRLKGIRQESKLILSPEAEQALILANSFYQSPDEETKSKIDLLLKKLDPNNSFRYNEESKDYDLELASLNGFKFNGTLTLEDFSRLPKWYVDIEKALFRKDSELIYINRRKRFLKALKKEEDGTRRSRLRSLISRLEERLSFEVPYVGKVSLLEDRFDERISWIPSISILNDSTEVRELYTLHETNLDEINGFKVIKCESESDLFSRLFRKVKDRKAAVVISYTSYDPIELRNRSRKLKTEKLDIVTKDKEPQRDFSLFKGKKRLREDPIYIDPYAFFRSAVPYIQKHRLDDIARFFGIDFKKSLTYDELRVLEIQTIASEDKEIRIEAARRIAQYATQDVSVLKRIVDSTFMIPFLFKLKNIMPYATLTELCFSPSSADRFWDMEHYKRCRNLRLSDRYKKIRNDETRIARKRLGEIRNEIIRNSDIPRNNSPRSDVIKLYMPLEERLAKKVLFDMYIPWYHFHSSAKSDLVERFAALQYVKSCLKEVMVDYYFCIRERKHYELGLSSLNKNDLEDKIKELLKIMPDDEIKDAAMSLENLKNNFRTAYVSLDSKIQRSLGSKPKKVNKDQILFEYATYTNDEPDLLEILEPDIIRLRVMERDKVKALDAEVQRKISNFKGSFTRFEKTVSSLENLCKTTAPDVHPRNLLYLAIQKYKSDKEKRRFYGRWLTEPLEGDFSMKAEIDKYYQDVINELRKNNASLVMHHNDYLFITCENPDFDPSILIPVQKISNFLKERSKKLEEALVFE